MLTSAKPCPKFYPVHRKTTSLAHTLALKGKYIDLHKHHSIFLILTIRKTNEENWFI